MCDKGYHPNPGSCGRSEATRILPVRPGLAVGLELLTTDPTAYVPSTRMSSDVPKFRAADKVIRSGIAGGVAGCVVCTTSFHLVN